MEAGEGKEKDWSSNHMFCILPFPVPGAERPRNKSDRVGAWHQTASKSPPPQVTVNFWKISLLQPGRGHPSSICLQWHLHAWPYRLYVFLSTRWFPFTCCLLLHEITCAQPFVRCAQSTALPHRYGWSWVPQSPSWISRLRACSYLYKPPWSSSSVLSATQVFPWKKSHGKYFWCENPQRGQGGERF